MADVIHYERLTVGEIREYCIKNQIEVRNFES